MGRSHPFLEENGRAIAPNQARKYRSKAIAHSNFDSKNSAS
ncbi:hypothetical protein [Nostoc sp.]